jgi:hypothetical protein
MEGGETVAGRLVVLKAAPDDWNLVASPGHDQTPGIREPAQPRHYIGLPAAHTTSHNVEDSFRLRVATCNKCVNPRSAFSEIQSPKVSGNISSANFTQSEKFPNHYLQVHFTYLNCGLRKSENAVGLNGNTHQGG